MNQPTTSKRLSRTTLDFLDKRMSPEELKAQFAAAVDFLVADKSPFFNEKLEVTLILDEEYNDVDVVSYSVRNSSPEELLREALAAAQRELQSAQHRAECAQRETQEAQAKLSRLAATIGSKEPTT